MVKLHSNYKNDVQQLQKSYTFSNSKLTSTVSLYSQCQCDIRHYSRLEDSRDDADTCFKGMNCSPYNSRCDSNMKVYEHYYERIQQIVYAEFETVYSTLPTHSKAHACVLHFLSKLW